MTIRNLNLSDLAKLENHRNGFPMPNVCNPTYFLQLAVEDKELIAAAFAKLTTEIILIFNKDISNFCRTKATIKLLEYIENEHVKRGLDDTHVFLSGDDDKSFERLLLTLGFVKATGTPLYYQAGTWQKDKLNKQLLVREN